MIGEDIKDFLDGLALSARQDGKSATGILYGVKCAACIAFGSRGKVQITFAAVVHGVMVRTIRDDLAAMLAVSSTMSSRIAA